MKKILIAGCGGAPSEGVINSLLKSETKEQIIGVGADPTDMMLSKAEKKYIVPLANSAEYKDELLKIIAIEKPDLVHFQSDAEIFEISKFRDEITSLGTKLYIPSHEVIDICVNKWKSYKKWEKAPIKVPRNIKLDTFADLELAFKELSDKNGNIWVRASSIGGGGKGSLPSNDIEFTKRWIDRFNGWGDFIAAEILTSDTVTFTSIWYEGELIVAQTRRRKAWTHGNRTLSGVTGVTKIGETYSDSKVTDIALASINAIDVKPHGIYCVDMTYDTEGVPNPTEINISRFFTTVLFFTEAGLNLPEIFKDIALYNKFPKLQNKINPLPEGLLWLRGMDTQPRLTTSEVINSNIIRL